MYPKTTANRGGSDTSGLSWRYGFYQALSHPLLHLSRLSDDGALGLSPAHRTYTMCDPTQATIKVVTTAFPLITEAVQPSSASEKLRLPVVRLFLPLIETSSDFVLGCLGM